MTQPRNVSFGTTELQEAEAALCQIPGVDDALVTSRMDARGELHIVAYVVPGELYNPRKTADRLQRALPQNRRQAIVPVSVLPLDSQGNVDVDALTSFPVLTAAVTEKVQATLEYALNVAETTVSIAPKGRDSQKMVRLAELALLRTGQQRGAEAESDPRREVPPSISEGEHLALPVPRNLGDLLQSASRTSRGIIHVTRDGEERQTYQELYDDALRILSGLREAGCGVGSCAVLQFDRTIDFVAAFFACAMGGVTAVPLGVASTFDTVNADVTKLYNVWRLLDRPVVLSRAGLLDAVEGLGGELDLTDWRVLEIERLRLHVPGVADDISPEADAVILFTSGSTGAPKGAIQTHHALSFRSAAAAQADSMTSQDRFLNWFPLDHVGGLVFTLVYAMYLGSEQILLPPDLIIQDPLRWLDLMDGHRVSRTWAPNFAYALINAREAEIRTKAWDLTCVRVFANGGEAVAHSTAARFLNLLAPYGLKPNTMQPCWGMSETSSGITASRTFDPGAAETRYVEVGPPLPGTALRIVDADGVILPEGQNGQLQVRGPTVTRGYFGNPGATAEAFTADGWFSTGDLAVLSQGRLTITGRLKDVIIVNGVNYASHEIEAVVEGIDGVLVTYTAACAVRPAGSQTDQLCVFFCPTGASPVPAVVSLIRDAVIDAVGVAPAFVIPVTPDEIPKTSIGKIQRTVLRTRFERGEFGQAQAGSVEGPDGLPDWFFEQKWHRKAARGLRRTCVPTWLIVGEGNGIASTACRHLGHSLTVVTPGSVDGHLRASAEEYPLGIVFECSPSAMNEALIADLIETVRAIQDCRANVHEFIVVTQKAACVLADDVRDGRWGFLHGLLKSIALELPGINCRRVDVEGDSERDVLNLAHEISTPATGSSVAFRQDVRYEHGIARVDLAALPLHNAPIESGGLYLVTGGLGGIGTVLSEWLHNHFGAKLLLLGRTELVKDPQTPAQRQRAERARRLKSAGVDFLYIAADVADPTQLRSAVADAESHFGRPMLGAFHLAGELSPDLGEADVRDSWTHNLTPQHFSAVQRAKVEGARTLLELLHHRTESLFVGFSSALGTFGAAGFAPYCAANSALDALCEARGVTHPNTYSIAWGMWDETGMSAGNSGYLRDLYASRGYETFPPSQGFEAMFAVLCRRKQLALFGLSAANPAIRRRLLADARALEEVTVASKVVDSVTGQEMDVHDAFGTRVCWTWLANEELRDPADQLPQTATEQEVSRIWMEMLNVEAVSRADRFINLGGDSIAAIRVVNRIREVFRVQILFRDILRGSLSSLSASIDTARAATSIVSPEETSAPDEDIDLEGLSEEELDLLLEQLAPERK